MDDTILHNNVALLNACVGIKGDRVRDKRPFNLETLGLTVEGALRSDESGSNYAKRPTYEKVSFNLDRE